MSVYADRLTLNGDMLMVAMAACRITRDANLAVIGIDNEEATVAAVVSEIVAAETGAVDVLRLNAGEHLDRGHARGC